jgi:hypothetical protein
MRMAVFGLICQLRCFTIAVTYLEYGGLADLSPLCFRLRLLTGTSTVV